MLDLYAVRGAMAVSRAPDGEYLFLEDAAPVRPGQDEPLYYGSAVGNHVIREWYLSETRPPVLLGRIPPGGRKIVSREVGPRGWATGIYDLKFVDAATGRQLRKGDLAKGETVGIKTFLAPLKTNPYSFLAAPENRGKVLPTAENDLVHMRGLFVPGSYPDNLQGEAVSKQFTVHYAADSKNGVSFALAAGENDQGEDPAAPNYVPDVFLNDRMRNGFDPSDGGKKGVNGGNYGVGYTVHLNLRGPVALVVQGAVFPGGESHKSNVDLHNQILTLWLDGEVRTVQIRDPNYDQFYTDLSALRPPGYGKVVAVLKEEGTHSHVLRFTLPPNGYGPVRFYLLPTAG